MIENRNAITAPDFTMKDTDGRSLQLQSYADKKHIVLVFNRGFM